MADDRTDTPGSPEARGTDPAAPEEEGFGPLLLRRMVKDDGRALLIYALAPAEDGAS